MSGKDKDFKITKGIISNTHSERHLLTLSRNTSFCQSFIKKINISTTVSDEDIARESNLVYSLPKSSEFDYDAIQAIIDLLLQLRAAQSDQNVFVQNNTVVRQQILRQLKNELTRVQSGLTQNQIKKLNVVSSNTFDEDTLNELLNSLLEDSKKKLDENKSKRKNNAIVSKNTNTEILHNLNEKYTKLINSTKHNEHVVNEVLNKTYRKENIYKYLDENIPKLEYVKEKLPVEQTFSKNIINREVFENQKSINNLLNEENISYEKRILNKYNLIPKIQKSHTDIIVSDLKEKYKSIAKNIFEKVYSKYRLFYRPQIENGVLEDNIKYIQRLSFKDQPILKSKRKNIVSYEDVETLNKKQILNISRLVSQVDKISSKISNLNLSQEIKDTVLNIWQNAYSKYINSFEESRSINQNVVRENEYENISKSNIVYSNVVSSYDKVKEQVYKEIEDYYTQNNIVSRESKTLKNILVNILEKKELSDLYSEVINKKITHARTNILNDAETKITNTKQDNLLINKRKFLRKNIDISEITNKDSFIYKTIETSIKKILQSNVKENISEIFKDENYKRVFTDIIRNIRKKQISRLNQIEKEKKIKEKKKTKYTSDTTIKEKKLIDKVEENVYDTNIFKVSEAVKNIRRNEKLRLKENITNLRKNILVNKINKELTVNLLDKQEYKNLVYDRYAVIDKHYLQTQKINEKQLELGIKSIYEDKVSEKASQKRKTVKFDEEPKKLSKREKQIDLVSKIINKSLVSEILSNKEYINIDTIKNDVVKNYKTQVNKIKQKTLETNLERLYQEQLNKVEKINRKVIQTDRIISRISKLKNTVDTIYKVSNKSKILEFFVKNHNIKTKDIKNLISNRHYFDTTREYEENIRSDIRDVFQEEISKTNRIYRTNTDYSVNQRVIKENVKQINKAVDKSKNIQTNVQNLTKENLKVDSKINTKLNKYNLFLSNVSREDLVNKEYKNIDFINKNIKKRYETFQKILVNDDLEFYDGPQKVYRNNIINTQIQNENINVKKGTTVTDNKFVNEKVKLVTENILNKVLKTNLFTHKNIKTSKDIFNIENISEVYRDVPLTIKENINQIYSIENFIPRKKLKILSPKVMVDKTVTHQQKDIYRDVVQSIRSYYNDTIENMGREHLIKEKKILQDENFHRNVIKKDMVYKTPLNLEKIQEKEFDQKKKEKEDVFHPDIITKKVSKEEYEAQNNLYQPKQKKLQKKEKNLNKNDIISIIKSYIGDISAENISKIVIKKVEDKIKFDRKRKGIL